MIRTLTYTLTPSARLSPGSSGQVGARRDAHTVIPGATIRGALAAAWWARSGAPARGSQQAFDRVFGQLMDVRSASPTSAKLRPMALAQCKYPSRGCSSPSWTVRHTLNEKVCTVCRTGFREGRGWDVGHHLTVEVTRTAMEGGRAKPEQLFTRQAIRRANEFTGHIRLTGDSQVVDETAGWLAGIPNVHVGGQLSTMGECTFTVTDKVPASPSGTGTFLVALASPAVLVDDHGAPTLDLAGALQQVVGAWGTVGDAWVRPTRVSGWSGRAGMTKPEDWAVDAGSCAVLEVTDSGVHESLSGGIGIRRAEGYGEVAARRPQDWISEENAR